MIHAKTAVADGIWSRVGSSNLNLASLLGNWELDVAILDREVAHEMEELFTRDMQSSVELRLRSSRRGSGFGNRFVHREPVLEPQGPANLPEVEAARFARQRAPRGRRVARLLGRMARAASVLGRALVGQRTVGGEDRGWIALIALGLFCAAAIGFVAPRVLAWPLAVLLALLGIATLVRVWPRGGQG